MRRAARGSHKMAKTYGKVMIGSNIFLLFWYNKEKGCEKTDLLAAVTDVYFPGTRRGRRPSTPPPLAVPKTVPRRFRG